MTKKLFSMFRYAAMLAVVMSLFVLSSCDEGEEAPTKSIYQLISEDPTLSMIKAQIDLNADLKAKLEATSGSYTFFAPNDLAMAAILTTLSQPDFTNISPGVLSTVLNYHLANQVKYTADFTEGSKVATAQGEEITIEVTTTGAIKLKTGATTNGSIVGGDVKATNGVLHVVGDYPLIPPSVGGLILATLGKVAQPVLLGKDFSILSAAILKADAGKSPDATIVGAMVGQSNQTFFAIPNAVFDAASITVDDYNAAQWDGIIRGHLIPGKTISTLGTSTETSITGKTILVTSTTVQGTANANPINIVTAAKIQTANGVVYPIQGIIQHIP